MRTRTKILWVLGLSTIVLLGAGATYRLLRESPDAFSWDTVTRGEIRETISASGEIQARTRINIGTSVAGEIKVLHVKDGQDVKVGDLLVTIDQERLRQQMSQAVAMLDATRKDAARLEAAMKRSRESVGADGIPLPPRPGVRRGLPPGRSWPRRAPSSASRPPRPTWSSSEANVAVMRDSLGKTVIKAPIAGRVTALKAEMGETAIPGHQQSARRHPHGDLGHERDHRGDQGERERSGPPAAPASRPRCWWNPCRARVPGQGLRNRLRAPSRADRTRTCTR